MELALRRASSATFRASISYSYRTHLTTFPDASREGLALKRNQLCFPSKRRMRALPSRPAPEARIDRQ